MDLFPKHKVAMCELSLEEEEELSAHDDDEGRHHIWNDTRAMPPRTEYHVSCDSHLRSHAHIVFLITSLSLKQASVCFSDVMSHLQAKTF